MNRARIGLVGGGQLGRMLALAGHRLGLIFTLYAGQEEEAATAVIGRQVHSLEELADQSDVITFEHEWADLAQLQALAGSLPIWPSLETLAIIQDKYLQKVHLYQAGLPVPAFTAPETWQDVRAFGEIHGLKMVLKNRRDSYDGHGTCFINLSETAPRSVEGLFVETSVPFERELAVMVARSPQRQIACYPVVETRQVGGVCDTVLIPAPISADLAERAQTLAQQAVEAVGAVGVVGVELFVCRDGQLWINELAPRPHNSGHYTLEACVTSQFEQHLRAILGWPLGSTALVQPAAVMVNLFGVEPVGDPWAVLALPEAHLHWYGKTSRLGRKVGHITVLADTVEGALAQAEHARQLYTGGAQWSL